MPNDLGAHYRISRRGVVHALKTSGGGALKLRVTTSSRADFRSTDVRYLAGAGLSSFPASTGFLLAFQLFDNFVQRIEARGPLPVIAVDPRRFRFQPSLTQFAGPHAADLFRRDQPRPLKNADMFLHARKGHVEFLGKLGDRGVLAAEPLQNTAPRGVGEGGERSVESGGLIMNHMVQYSEENRSMQ